MRNWREILSDNEFWGLFRQIAPAASVSAGGGGYAVSGGRPGGPRIRLDLWAEAGRMLWRVDAETDSGQFYYSGREDERSVKSVLSEVIEVYLA